MARLDEHGLGGKLKFLIGVVPLRSAKSARWIKDKLYGAIIPDALIARMESAIDPVAEGRAICADFIRELAEIPQVAGVHVMAPNNDAAVPVVIATARASIKRPKPPGNRFTNTTSASELPDSWATG